MSSANSILIQGDGKVIVGGRFSTLAGLTRNGLGRLSLNMSVQQQLEINNDGTTVVWTRGESGPELWRVTFDISTDGYNYLALGEGTRMDSGWQLNGVVLPRGQNLWIRARGYFTETGYQIRIKLDHRSRAECLFDTQGLHSIDYSISYLISWMIPGAFYPPGDLQDRKDHCR